VNQPDHNPPPRLEPDLGDPSDLGLSAADAVAVGAVIAEASRLAAPGQEPLLARRVLLDGAAALLNADNWLWVLGRAGLTSGEWRIAPIKILKCGRVPMLRGAWHALRMMGAFGRPPETVGLHDLALAGRPFVRSIRQVLPPQAWDTDPACLTYRRRIGMDDLLYTVLPQRGSDSLTVSSVMFGRSTGAPAFTARERGLAAALFFAPAWVHALTAPASPTGDDYAARVARLSEKEQQLVPLLASDLGYAQIGAMTGLTENTIKTYAVRIFRSLGVRNRNALRDRVALIDPRLARPPT
jgi:DNA-binding CsgD family transcriptional regulator